MTGSISLNWLHFIEICQCKALKGFFAFLNNSDSPETVQGSLSTWSLSFLRLTYAFWARCLVQFTKISDTGNPSLIGHMPHCVKGEDEPMETSLKETSLVCTLLVSFACISFLFAKRSSPRFLRTRYHKKTTSSIKNNALPQKNVQQRKLTLPSSHPSNISTSNSPPYLLFVHIPKTGGTAIGDSALDYGFSWGEYMVSRSKEIRLKVTNRYMFALHGISHRVFYLMIISTLHLSNPPILNIPFRKP